MLEFFELVLRKLFKKLLVGALALLAAPLVGVTLI
jgi:hypothetical protein